MQRNFRKGERKRQSIFVVKLSGGKRKQQTEGGEGRGGSYVAGSSILLSNNLSWRMDV